MIWVRVGLLVDCGSEVGAGSGVSACIGGIGMGVSVGIGVEVGVFGVVGDSIQGCTKIVPMIRIKTPAGMVAKDLMISFNSVRHCVTNLNHSNLIMIKIRAAT
jgi:hypothetical protein